MDYSKAKRLLQELKESKYIPIYNVSSFIYSLEYFCPTEAF
jgi:hypothetical protein